MSEINISMTIRDQPEFEKLIADLKQLQADIDSKFMSQDEASERLTAILTPWIEDD